jgi:hypothetical protein
MMKEADRTEAFDKFMEGVGGLLGDRNFREVLQELDREGEEAASLLAPDPAAFLRQRGVRIPEDFRLSVVQEAKEAVGTRLVCYCLEVCWWRWCIRICFCRIRL